MRALILVDIQNDFLPGGALAVPEGDRVIAVANALMPLFPLVVATQDWHPPDHGSFAANHAGRAPGEVVTLAGLQQVLWPTHCVQGTRGAEFAGTLQQGPVAQIFVKGVDAEVDSYSGFFDNGRRRSTGLGEYLRAHEVREAVVLGLATDYCVKFTALDALSLGMATTLVEDGCRGVELRPGDVAAALDEVRAAGGAVRRSADLLG
ncbi:nicotinamidase/pyrazinamidase [Nannocystis exedens]|uniref:Nicotinamidase n=1 Tax=Nannocystis exedens TaxID=54 RepID=A0A1I2BBD0_9BACT|nr:bifunctional nicotinamidase/pyrazinamidase [Nannocystis exedens]PCC68078.1 nicotinamidase [Nannocystis exedens]SFE53369.1 nicotinamidase/pyrazinamidase [Nannocystis exedens]